MRKISPDPRDIKTVRAAASAEIYAARISAITAMASCVGKIMSGSLKSNKTAFQNEQKLAEQDEARARVLIDAETEFLKKMNQEMIEMTRELNSEIAKTPHPRVNE